MKFYSENWEFLGWVSYTKLKDAGFDSDIPKNDLINLENNLIGTTAAAYAAVNLKKATMKQVAYLNALARGEVVENMEDADTIFTADKDSVKKQLEKEPKSKEARIITQWDLDIFMSDFI